MPLFVCVTIKKGSYLGFKIPVKLIPMLIITSVKMVRGINSKPFSTPPWLGFIINRHEPVKFAVPDRDCSDEKVIKKRMDFRE
jgi:hypothetical protein